ncbi:MAG: Shikimate kinase [Chlamydiia bacterium]|nr:Shikimate kinase [Chlamydiia bacterium]
MKESIVLIGYKGVGKSSFGKRLAEYFDMEFIDVDIEMEERDLLGRSNRQIFLGDGEKIFRKKEQEVMFSLIGKQNTVISTGGGVVEIPNAKEILSQFTKVIYLYSEIEVLQPRWPKPRVFLKGMSLEEAFARRDRLYRQVCTEIVEGSWDQILSAKCLQ